MGLFDNIIGKYIGGSNNDTQQEDPSTQGFGNWGFWNNYFTPNKDFSVGQGWNQQVRGNNLLDMLSGSQVGANPFMSLLSSLRNYRGGGW